MTVPPPLPPPSPPFKVVPPSFEHGLELPTTLIREGGGGGDSKHVITDTSLKPNRGTVSQVFLQLVVAL